MSQYLVSRIENSTRITVYPDSEISSLDGNPSLEHVTWINTRTGTGTTKRLSTVFVMIGAEPNTRWLSGTVRLDTKGFVLTGPAGGFDSSPYATSMQGIFAVGDVRSDSIKRVASAVGEGSVVVSYIHRYLASHIGESSAPAHSAPSASLPVG
jgi:thioredoxin reductase (NADPH)